MKLAKKVINIHENDNIKKAKELLKRLKRTGRIEDKDFDTLLDIEAEMGLSTSVSSLTVPEIIITLNRFIKSYK